MYRYVFVVLLTLSGFCNQVFSQSCTIVASTNTVCLGNAVSFSVTVTGGTPTGYNWSFGDASTSSSPQPLHNYLSAGTFTPSVTVNLAGGGTCTATGSVITVYALPIASYVITSPDTLCFEWNQLCINDESTPGPSGSGIKKRVFQLSNGYIQTNNAPYSNTICYANNVDVLGHLYTIVLEVTDFHGCVSRLEKKDSVLLLPKVPAPSFTFSDSMHCTYTAINIINTSPRPSSQYKSFKWDFGDGQTNTTTWTNVRHQYTPPGANPILYVDDIYGCKDTAVTLNHPLDFIFPDSAIYINKKTQCFLANELVFMQKSRNGEATWTIYDNADNVVYANIQYDNDSLRANMRNCGVYRLNLKMRYADSTCNSVTDSFVQIFGPNAIMKNDTIKPLWANQCEIHDTVYFVQPTPYLSCHSGNPAMRWYWDFGDMNAPPCTTDTRNGINVNMNCNFSLDSTGVKHWYSAEKCYNPKLYMTDTVTHCSDGDSTLLMLQQADAGPDTASGRGLYTDLSTKYICRNTPVNFFLDKLLPECGYEKAWINFDSACFPPRWQILDTINPQVIVNHLYSSTCDTTGNITVGLIIKNGQDASGHDCYDTGWYHMMLYMPQMKPQFDFTLLPRPNCGPYQVEFKLKDTVQPNLNYVFWDFIADTPKTTDTTFQFLNGDSIIKRQQFGYKYPGIYRVYVGLKDNLAGCFDAYSQFISLGVNKEVAVLKKDLCMNDTFTIYQRINYFNSDGSLNPYPYWEDPARAAANLERIWWDIGDGKGFVYQGPNPNVKYTKPGKYTIRMIAQDSLGCKDTFTYASEMTIYKLEAIITTPGTQFFCAPQIIQFGNASAFVDSMGNAITTANVVDTTLWQFDDFKPSSNLDAPAHNFTSNGTFKVTLYIHTFPIGCRAIDTAAINIRGPQPAFVIASDTMGCSPFTVRFDNTTVKHLLNWTWYYGDSNNTLYSTPNDSDVTFTYTKPGIYDVRLLGFDTVYNPSTGNMKQCSVFFPDSVTHLPIRKVYVIATPPLNIVAGDTICPKKEMNFIASGDSVYYSFKWNFGDGGTDSTTRPDTSVKYAYQIPGTYHVMLTPTVRTSLKCIDTAYKDVFVQTIKADFDVDDSKAPVYSFINKSSPEAVRYQWDFGQPKSGANNTSTEKDASHNYGNDTGTFKICLMAFNKDDCWDSICKTTKPTAHVNIPNVFTPANNDGLNDAFDIDIQGYSKYDLVIYNRWGGLVFKTDKDGIDNDGVNWNGKEQNTGSECPGGVYYFIFTYHLVTEQKEVTVHGTVTLIR